MPLKCKRDHVTPSFKTFQWLLLSFRTAKASTATAQPHGIWVSPPPPPPPQLSDLITHLAHSTPATLASLFSLQNALHLLPGTPIPPYPCDSLPHHFPISATKSSSRWSCPSQHSFYIANCTSLAQSLSSLLYFFPIRLLNILFYKVYNKIYYKIIFFVPLEYLHCLPLLEYKLQADGGLCLFMFTAAFLLPSKCLVLQQVLNKFLLNEGE